MNTHQFKTKFIQNSTSCCSTSTLLHSPYTVAPLFFGGAIYSLKIAAKFHSRSQYYRIEELNLLAFPLVYWNKHICTFFWKPSQQLRITKKNTAKHIFYGSLLGFGTAGLGLWVAHQQKWIVFVDSACSVYSIKDIFLSFSFIMTGMMATAYNEETVFRGYGFDVCSHIIGSTMATVVLTGLFIRFHGNNISLVRKIAYGMLGTNLLLLRHMSNSIALPIAYHWAWNVALQGIWGPTKSEISLKPYYINENTQWMGSSPQANEAKPGWLMVVLQGIFGLILWCIFKKQQHNKY